jgi:dienelactone hydrolase
MLKALPVAVLVFACAAAAVQADVKTKGINYTYNGVTLKGYLAWDDSAKEKRPGVLVVHEWWGLNDYARKRAEQLAGLGYVAFACDMYGEGKVTEHPKEAAQMAGELRKNLETWLGRAQAGLKVLREQDQVDPTRVASIGYCFGGSTALQLAYSGADLKAVVTFHAAVPVPEAKQAEAIKAKLMICHGAADSFIPEETLQKARNAYDAAKVDYQMLYFGGAVHSFTVPGIDRLGVKGLAYNAEADQRSWQDMQQLFRETLTRGK